MKTSPRFSTRRASDKAAAPFAASTVMFRREALTVKTIMRRSFG
jgi:hypothetical protein